ncbi:hypothetical protein PGIGA_G00055480 [Pangasianodon gigas]|uniref:Uncharacterized protein n=1 Tax=Pangasianodon gigas TaxID=30993 RepID=A0ACC5X3K9_PANGG|nr:hypothetical protein [Pangasianodon gigas]
MPYFMPPLFAQTPLPLFSISFASCLPGSRGYEFGGDTVGCSDSLTGGCSETVFAQCSLEPVCQGKNTV